MSKFIPSLCAALVVCAIVTPPAMAVNNIDSIMIMTGRELGDSIYWLDIMVTGTDLSGIDVYLPGNETDSPDGSMVDFGDMWVYESDPNDSTDPNFFGTSVGDAYGLDFHFSDATIWTTDLEYTPPGEPTGWISIVEPIDNSLDPNFSFDATGASGDFMGVFLYGPGSQQDVPRSEAGAFNWEPNDTLQESTWYDLEAGVFNANGMDGTVDIFDDSDDEVVIGTVSYLELFEHTNEVEYETIPEPATLSLIAIGAVALLRRRRK